MHSVQRGDAFEVEHCDPEGFPGGSVVKNLPAIQEAQIRSLGQQDPLEKEMATHSSILAWEIPGQRSLVGCSPQGHKVLDTTERLSTAQDRLVKFNV